MTNLKEDKRGSLVDVLFWALGLTVFAIVVLVGFKVMSEVDTKFQDGSLGLPVEATTASTQIVNTYDGILDNAFLFLTIGLVIVSLALAAFVRIHPIFIPFFMMGLFFLTFIAGILSNIYTQIASQTELVAQAEQLIFITHVLTFLPFIVAIFGVVIMVVLYKVGPFAE